MNPATPVTTTCPRIALMSTPLHRHRQIGRSSDQTGYPMAFEPPPSSASTGIVSLASAPDHLPTTLADGLSASAEMPAPRQVLARRSSSITRATTMKGNGSRMRVCGATSGYAMT